MEKLFFFFSQAIGKSLGVQLQDPKKVINKKTSTVSAKPTAIPPTGVTLRNHEGKIEARTDSNIFKPKIVPAKKAIVPTKTTNLKKIEEKIATTTEVVAQKITNLRRSLDVEKTDDSSLYISALEDVSEGSANKFGKIEKINEKVN